jgi:hypothetical protein
MCGTGTTCKTCTAGQICSVQGCYSGGSCGGIAGTLCSRNSDFCDYYHDDCTFSTDQGVCTPMPSSCPDTGPSVLGCDGMTYKNACTALMSGIHVKR